ncbi:MAG: chloride channel protein [Bdellovibrio sp.]
MDKSIDLLYEKSRNLYQEGYTKIYEVRSHIVRLLPFWVAAVITAATANAYAYLFSLSEELSHKIVGLTGFWFLLIAPICFFISWLLVEKGAKNANGSGIPQLMVAVSLNQDGKKKLIDAFLGVRIIIVKLLSSLASVIGGGAVGREGPTLQISGSIFHFIDKKWTSKENREGFLLAGAACGLASAFNTPLGGIVYVIEELAKSHITSFRTGVIQAVIFAGVITQMIMGPYLYFGYPKTIDFQYNMILEVALLSVFSGAVVAFFAKSLKTIVIFRGRIQKNKYKAAMAILSGLIFAVAALFFSKTVLGPGKDLLNDLLFKEHTANFSDMFARFCGSALTYSNGGAGGIFAPTLSLGGAASSWLGQFLNYQFGPLAVLVGMTAGLAALTHSPLTSFILILEMTDRHKVIFPLMIAAVVGHGISKMFSKKSFYEFVFERILSNLEKVENESSNRI